MMNRRKCQLICVLSAVVFQGAAVASAQQKIEIFRGTQRDGASEKNVIPGQVTRSETTAAPAATSTAPQPDVKAAPRYSPEAQEQILATSRSLADSSFQSFRRGLMPLHDHLDQLQFAADSEFRLAGKDGQADVATRYVEQLRRVELALRDFNAPNAVGWRADLLLAQAMVAQAEFDLATVEGDEEQADFAGERATILAERHLIERRFDSSVGLASLPMLLHAEMLTPEGAVRGREMLVQVVDQTRRWNELGAGIGRSDKLATAEFELARFDFFTAFDSPEQDIEESFTAASEASGKLLEQKMEFYKNGTADLFEIAQAWRNMQQLVEFAASTKTGVSPDVVESSRTNLELLVELATAKQDRQGRFAADVAYVSLLNEIATPE